MLQYTYNNGVNWYQHKNEIKKQIKNVSTSIDRYFT